MIRLGYAIILMLGILGIGKIVLLLIGLFAKR
jgi:hypothetical protein